MLKLILVTPKGELINDEFEMVVAKGDQGEVGILENRLPIILKISNGYVRATKEKETICAVVCNGILDNNNSVVTVVCEEAAIGESLEEASKSLDEAREKVRLSNKQKKIDFVEAEKDLAKAIKESKASKPI